MTRDDLANAFGIGNVYAFSMAVRGGESSLDDSIAYRMRYAGPDKKPVLVDDLSAHPHVPEPTRDGRTSTAAGAYQATWSTWSEEQRKWGWTSFGMQEQNEFFVARLVFRRALDAVIAGRFDEACRLCKSEWTSLPGGAEQNRGTSKALSTYLSYGGQLVAAPAQEVKPMFPVVVPILAELAKTLLPQLGQLLGSGSEVQQRNVAAATIAADAIVKATNAVNLQEAAERVQSDPDALAAAKEAVNQVVFMLTEAGGGGIDGARKFSAATDGLPFWKQGAFVISLLLLVFPAMLLADVFYVHPDSYDGNLRTQIVTAVLLVISMVGAFWLGSTMNSQRKTELMAGGKS